jgi:hypothetical protein
MMLAEHPDVLARLRREIVGAVGLIGKVGPENLKEMKYLRAILNGNRSTRVRRLFVLIFRRNFKVVSRRVRIEVLPYSCNQAKEGATVHGISNVPKKVWFGQPSRGENRSTYQVVHRLVICPG